MLSTERTQVFNSDNLALVSNQFSTEAPQQAYHDLNLRSNLVEIMRAFVASKFNVSPDQIPNGNNSSNSLAADSMDSVETMIAYEAEFRSFMAEHH